MFVIVIVVFVVGRAVVILGYLVSFFGIGAGWREIGVRVIFGRGVRCGWWIFFVVRLG